LALIGVVLTLGAVDSAGGQTPAELIRERSEFAGWLERAPASPFRAVVQHSIGPGIRLGPADTDVVLPGVEARLEQKGASLFLTVAGAVRPIPRNRLTPLGNYQLLAAGLLGQAVLTVFGPEAKAYSAPIHFPYASAWRFEVTLSPVARATAQRLLAADGVEVEATEAGTVAVPTRGRTIRLRVFRIPTAGGEESELEIYFRDGTNRGGSYPAGRFVSLVPVTGGRYLLDFNRARNPFCAYSSIYPCPAPWRGNTIPVPVAAGEKYSGGGLSKPPV